MTQNPQVPRQSLSPQGPDQGAWHRQRAWRWPWPGRPSVRLPGGGPTVYHPARWQRSWSHEVRREVVGGETRVQSSSRIDVRLLGLALYRFRYDAREVWDRTGLARIEVRVDDDGEFFRLDGERSGKGFAWTSDAGRGQHPLPLFPTNHWNPKVLEQDQVLNTLTGGLNRVTSPAPAARPLNCPTARSRPCDTATPGTWTWKPGTTARDSGSGCVSGAATDRRSATCATPAAPRQAHEFRARLGLGDRGESGHRSGAGPGAGGRRHGGPSPPEGRRP